MKIRWNMMRYMKSFFRILKVSGQRYTGDQLSQQAIVLTYYTLFSIVPLAALLFGIAKGFGLDRQLLDAIYSRFPSQQEFVDYVCDFADKTIRQSSGGIVAGVGVIALFWTVIWLINNIEKAFNEVWGLPPRKNVIGKFSNYLSLVLITPVMMVAISTFGVMLRRQLTNLSEKLPEWSCMHWLFEGAADVAPILASCILFLAVYLFVPNTKVRFRGALLAAVITGICFQILQDSFLFLQGRVFSYNRIYGSFAILPLFLIWVNWSWQLILFGAEISFVHQHQRSGIFSDRGKKKSLKLRREYQLAILRMVFSAFESGAGATDESEIAAALRLPDVVMRNEIRELVELKILSRNTLADGRVFLLPGIPPEKFTVLDFLRSVNGSGDEETPEFARYDRIFSKMEEHISGSELNKPLHRV